MTQPVPASSETTPPIVTKLVALAVALAGPALAFFHPHHTLSGSAVQAAVVLAGLMLGAAIYIVHLVLENGLSKAGLEKSLSDEEQWVRDNYASLRSTFEAAKPALDAIPGVPAALTAVQGDLADLKAKIPAADQAAVEAAVRSLVIPGVLKSAQPPVATVTTPLPAPPPAA